MDEQGRGSRQGLVGGRGLLWVQGVVRAARSRCTMKEGLSHPAISDQFLINCLSVLEGGPERWFCFLI